MFANFSVQLALVGENGTKQNKERRWRAGFVGPVRVRLRYEPKALYRLTVLD